MKSKKIKIITLSILIVAVICSVIFAVGAADDTTTEYWKVVLRDVDTYRTDLNNKTAPIYDESGDWLFAGWFTDEACTKAIDSSMQQGSAYAKFVPADILGLKAQVNIELTDDDTTNDDYEEDGVTNAGAIRFVTSVDTLNYSSIGFKIKRGSGDVEDRASNKVYQQLYATGEAADGTAKTDKYSPSDLFHADASTYFKTWTYTKVPSSAYNMEITVTPYWVTLDGTTVTANQGMKTVNQGRSWEYVYVDDTGSDETGVGTSGHPYATLNKALSEMKANYKAPYTESYSLDATEGKDGIVCIKDSLTGASGFSWEDHGMDVIITSDVADISKLDISDKTTVIDESTLDLSAVQTVKVGDGVTFANMTLKLFGSTSQNGAVYATGNRFKIAGSVTSENPYSVVYGGGSGTNVPGTDVTILSGTYRLIYGGGRNSNVTGDTHVTLENTNVFDTTAGGEARVHGGCNKGTVEGDTHVTIGKGFNSSTEFNYATHSKYATVWGGGYGDNADTMSIVKGNTYVTVKDDAKANFISGGGFLYSEVQKTSHVIFEGGYAMSIYGGSAGSSKQENLDNDANGKSANTSVVMSGGEVQQVFGGNELGNMEGNTSVQILGGKVTRRVYGGCYNNTNTLGTAFTTSYSVKGNTSVVIGPKAELALNVDVDNALCAISRYNTTFANEVGTLIFNRDSYSKYESKVQGYSNQQPYHYLVDASGDGDVTVNGNVLHIKPDAKNQAIVKLDNQEVHYATGESDYVLPGITSATEKHTVTVEFAAIDENKDVSNYEAYIKDGGYYSTLEETVAMANVSTDETVVVLLADAEIDSTLTISDTANMTVQSKTGATYTVTYANTENNLFDVEGKLAITNLNLEGGKSGIYMNAGSEVTATDASVKRLSETGAAVVVIDKGAQFTLDVTKVEGEQVGTSSINGNSFTGRGVEVYGTFVLNGGAIKNNTVQNNGTTKVDGAGVYVAGTFTMNGGTIEGNTAENDGAGVHVPIGGNFTMTGGIIQENQASASGAGVSTRGAFEMTGGNIQGNKAVNHGAGVIVRYEGTISMTGGTIKSNTATANGGGIYMQSGPGRIAEIDGGIIESNTAADGGGVYINSSTTVTMKKGTIQNNTAAANGGGVYLLKAEDFVIKNGTVASNTAVDGGGVYVSSGQTFTMEDGTIQNNTAALKDDYSHGGGVYVAGTFTMSNGNIQNNAATSDKNYTFGAGVYVTGEFVMNGGSISHHGTKDARSKSKGAGVCVNEGGTFTMNDGSIEYNYASQAGAGVAVEAGTNGNSSFTMYGGTIANNNSSGAAGAIVVRANTAFTMKGGNINNNTASTTGGAVHTLGTVAINGGTIDDNTAANGAGVYVANSATFNMNAGTITNNTATKNGGGIFTQSVNTTITGGSIENNTATGIVEDEVLTDGNGGGLYVDTNGILAMENGTIKNNTAAVNGGGICLNTTDDTKENTFTGGVIEENDAIDGGGLYINVSKDVVMNDITIRNNIATQNGGGVYVNSSRNFEMESGAISTNTAVDGGGVYTYNKGKFTMTGGSIQENTATGYGSGVYVGATADNKPFTMSGGTISGHGSLNERSGSIGTGVYVASGSVFNMSGENAVIENNYSSTTGAGVAVAGIFAMTNGTIQGNNTTGKGAGVYVVDGAFNLNGGSIMNHGDAANSVAGASEGAGVYAAGTSIVTMTAGSISNNYVSGSGAGVSVDGTAQFTMEGGTISNNTAAASGGGMIVRSTRTETAAFVMNGGTISGNKALITEKNGGGAIFQHNGTMVEINNGEISGNESGANGGAIFVNANTAKLTMTGGTIKENTAATTGAGVCVNTGTFDMQGGTISNHGTSDNRSTSSGAGVYVASNATFNMSGDNTFIQDNYSSTTGAGVAVAGTFNMNGGTIQGNNTKTNGAGVHILTTGSLIMEGGYIKDNTATVYGGGIYQEGSLIINAGEISTNHSNDCGGGIYMVKGTAITVKDGKILGNITTNKNGAGIYAAEANIINLTGNGEISGNDAGTATVQGVFVQNAKSGSQVTLHTTFTMGNEIRYNSLSTRGTDNPALIIKGSSLDYTLNLGFHNTGTVYIQCDSKEAAEQILSKINQYKTSWTLSHEDGSSYIKATTK